MQSVCSGHIAITVPNGIRIIFWNQPSKVYLQVKTPVGILLHILTQRDACPVIF